MTENLSRVRDYASILPTKMFQSKQGYDICVKHDGDEYAYKHLRGEPYEYSNLLERVLKYLQGKESVSEDEIKMRATQNRYPHEVTLSVIHRLKQLENVGYSKRQFTLYEHSPDSELRQQSLDEPF